MAAAEWYYTLNNQQQGPVTLDALQAMAANGQIQRTDLVWRQGMANWTAAGDVPGVFGGGVSPAAQAGWQGPAMGGYNQAQGPSFASEAKTAMFLSIAGILCCGILGIVGLIQGINIQKKMAASGNYEGKGMATAAVVCGAIACVFMAVGIFVRLNMRHGRGF